MKIDLSGFFKVINTIFEVKRMSVAERILLRQKKDLIDYVAVHFSSFVKTIVVLGFLVLITKHPELIPFSNLLYYWMVGTLFLVFDAIGIKALFGIMKRFVIQFWKLLKTIYLEIKKYFETLKMQKVEKKIQWKILTWIATILFFPIFLVIILLKVLFLSILYGATFTLITFLSNESLSLIITHSAFLLIATDNIYVIYVMYSVAAVVSYIIIDYRVRVSIEELKTDMFIENGQDQVVGLKLLNTNGKIYLYQRDKQFLVLDNYTKELTLYSVDSKILKYQKSFIDWIKRKKDKSKPNNQNLDTRDIG